MKKNIYFLISFVLLSMATANAQTQANIYASGLKAEKIDNTNYAFTYTLNADATSLTINFDGSSSKQISNPDLLTKGTHTTTLNLSDLVKGEYKWSITAAAAANETLGKISNDDSRFKFYFPMGLAVDNSFESPYFGRIYVSEAAGSRDVEATPETYFGDGRITDSGIYIFDALLDAVNDNAYTGNIPWVTTGTTGVSAGGGSPWRLAIDAAGKVYIADNSIANSGIYIMDPADPEADFSPVFNDASRDETGIVANVHGRVSGIYIEGSGENTVLYTVDRNYLPTGYDARTYLPSGMVFKYNIGNLAAPYSQEPTIIYDNTGSRLANEHLGIVSDKRGGFWICQNRSADAAGIPSIMHIPNGSDTYDYVSANQSLFSGVSNNATSRGSIAINKEGSLLAIGSDRKVKLFSIAYDSETNIPSLTLITETSVLGTNIDGMAIDVADNVYALSASTERFYQFATPKEDNSFTTPAPAAQKIVIGQSGIIPVENLDNKVILVQEKGVIHLQANGLIISNYTIYNVTGIVVKSGTVGKSSIDISTSGLTTSVYMIQLKTDKGSIVKRFINK